MELNEVVVNFECEKCQKTLQLPISDAISDGAPECCGSDMLMVDCEVTSQMVFA